MKILASVLFAAIIVVFTLFPTPTAKAQPTVQVCHAETVCHNGVPIQCTVYGYVTNGAGGCLYRWVGGVEVECRGYIWTPNGWMWQRYYFHC